MAEPEVSLLGLQASEEEVAGSGFRTSPPSTSFPCPVPGPSRVREEVAVAEQRWDLLEDWLPPATRGQKPPPVSTPFLVGSVEGRKSKHF